MLTTLYIHHHGNPHVLPFRSERQARDLAHCISQLSVSERSLRKLQDNFACYKDWLVDDLVFEAFSVLLSKNKKFTKPEVKGLLDELERLMKDAHEKGLETSVSIETSRWSRGHTAQHLTLHYRV